MFQTINERLAELKAKQRQKANWEQRVNALTQELQRATRERDQWAEQLDREQKDVDRLTGISLGALVYTLLGKKEARLSQEEAEVLQAKLKYEEAADTAADLESELTELQRQLAVVRYIDSDIAAAMEEKTKLILNASPALAAGLASLTDQESETQASMKELQEAVSAGRSVISALNRAEDRLNSAKNWGTYDMLGGGFISTAVKHGRIDEARSAIHAAQNSLRRFQTELKDVQRDVNIHIDIGGLLTFADYFFDGLITDWIVQGRIKDSIDQVSRKRSQISRIVSELEGECRKTEAKLRELQRQRESLIENA